MNESEHDQLTRRIYTRISNNYKELLASRPFTFLTEDNRRYLNKEIQKRLKVWLPNNDIPEMDEEKIQRVMESVSRREPDTLQKMNENVIDLFVTQIISDLRERRRYLNTDHWDSLNVSHNLAIKEKKPLEAAVYM